VIVTLDFRVHNEVGRRASLRHLALVERRDFKVGLDATDVVYPDGVLEGSVQPVDWELYAVAT
jgi:hypothetical protein